MRIVLLTVLALVSRRHALDQSGANLLESLVRPSRYLIRMASRRRSPAARIHRRARRKWWRIIGRARRVLSQIFRHDSRMKLLLRHRRAAIAKSCICCWPLGAWPASFLLRFEFSLDAAVSDHAGAGAADWFSP